jgi:Fe-S cluster assembly ATP-binding protein
MIDINELHVVAGKKEILRGLNLKILPGEIHAIMGPNGSGKSTLANVIAGNEEYQVVGGKVEISNFKFQISKKKRSQKSRSQDPKLDLLTMKADERAKQGIFLSFQNPPVITGVEVGNFLRQIYLSRISNFKIQSSKQINQNLKTLKPENPKNQKKTQMSLGDFRIWVMELMKRLALKPEIFNSTLNETMSGGEKKKLEILQMIILKPKLIILDEIDSGLDVDALKIIAAEINRYIKENLDSSFLIISHYNRIFSYIYPDRVHVMKGGHIVKSGGRELVELVEQEGYVKY